VNQRSILAPLAALVLAAGCGSDKVVVPAQQGTSAVPLVAIVSGNQQQAVVNTQSTTPLVVRVTSTAGTPMSGVQVRFAVTSGGGSVTPTQAITDANGNASTLFTGGSTPGTSQVVAQVQGTGAQAAFSVTTVAPVPLASSCDAASPTQVLALGQVVTGLAPTGLCVAGGPNGSEYTLVPFNSSSVAGSTTAIEVTGRTIGVPVPTGLVMPSASLASLAPSQAPPPDANAESALRERWTRAVAPLVPDARAWYDRRTSRNGISAAVIPATVQVGDVLRLNVNSDDACSNATYHGARVTAVSTHAIVAVDTLNPPGGFTAAEYQSLATTFDTLVYPVDVNAFGAPSDIDGNGRVLILYTRVVNEMTPRASNSYVGGFFNGRDLFPTAGTSAMAGCPTSNVGEMFYMLAPDSLGQVNGNVRTKSMVSTVTVSTIAHEFQHLINASRRLFVNRSAVWNEEVWLNEGLSHIAEELVFYRTSGRGPRQDIDLATIRSSATLLDAFNRHEVANMQRYRSYLANPATFSPYAADDELSTRGAAWALLRYLADHLAGGEGNVWYQLVNANTSGLANLQGVFGPTVMSQIRDWATANYSDDLLTGITNPFQQPSWSYRQILPALGGFPLPVVTLVDGVPSPTSLVGGGAAYFHFAVSAGRTALVNVTSGGAAPSATVQFTLVRTR
jgi:hypothetical protein